MFDIEQMALASMSRAKRHQFNWLITNRECAARVIAEMGCWGVWDLPSLDQYLVGVEERICEVLDDPELSVVLMAEYAVHDAELLHPRGRPPIGFDCLVCRTGGEYSIDMVLSRLPEAFGLIDSEL